VADVPALVPALELPLLDDELMACAGAAGVMVATVPVQAPPAASCTVSVGWKVPAANEWLTVWPVAVAPSPNVHVNVYGASPPAAEAANATPRGASPEEGAADAETLSAG
jgi:hypothetical protein